MTKQNVLVPEMKSGINLAITMAMSNSSILTMASQKPPAAPGGYIPISRKGFLKNLEINGEGRINAWVDSMRASSPTHIKATPSLVDHHDQSSWIVSIRLFLLLSFLSLLFFYPDELSKKRGISWPFWCLASQ